MKSSTSTADEILNCARSLLSTGGYDGFSYADIAKIVGIRNASIHHHFPSKADLVRILVTRYREEAAAGLTDLERRISSPAEELQAYTGYWEACIRDATAPICVCAVLASQLPALPAEVAVEVRAHFEALSAWLTAVLERGAAEGSLSFGGTANAEAEMILACIHGAMLSARTYGDPRMFATIVHPMLDRLIVRS